MCVYIDSFYGCPFHSERLSLALPVAESDIIFLPCDFYLSSIFFPRLISAAADWMSAILRHMMWP